MYKIGLQKNSIKGLKNHGFSTTNIIIDGKGYDAKIYLVDYNPDKCWMCGRTQKSLSVKKIDRHHVLNHAWRPRFNFKIPLCRSCHDFVHYELPNSLSPHQTNDRKRIKYTLQHNKVVIDNLIRLLLNEKDLSNFDARRLILPYTGTMQL